MENSPTGPSPENSLTTEGEKKNKKKSGGREAEAKKIGSSLESLFSREDDKKDKPKAETLEDLFATKDETEVPESDVETEVDAEAAPLEEVGAAEEEPYINQTVARKHQAAEPSEPVVQYFLEQVAENGDVDAADQAAREAYGLPDDPIDELSPEVPVVPQPATYETEIPLNEEQSETTLPLAAAGSGGEGAGPPPENPEQPAHDDHEAFNHFDRNQRTAETTAHAPDLNTISRTEAAYRIRRAENNGLIVGGLLGYLVGRRRGRIKTEKRLLPVQKKLQKQITQLENKITDREDRLYRLAAAKAEAPQARVKPAERMRPGRQETRLGLEKPDRAERLGQVLVAAESNNRNDERAAAKGQAENLSRQELLELSEKITVEGASLRQAYDAHLFSEKGLRRIVAEYLHGGNVARALRRETIEREIDFERDPILRDRSKANGLSASGVSLLKLLENAGELPEGDEATQRALAQAQVEQVKLAHQARQRHIVDVSLATVIIVLLGLVLTLLLIR